VRVALLDAAAMAGFFLVLFGWKHRRGLLARVDDWARRDADPEGRLEYLPPAQRVRLVRRPYDWEADGG
jgi:hypothetical protein